MASEVVSAKLTDDQVKILKTLVAKFIEINPKCGISGPKFGQIGDGILMSLKIDSQYFEKFVKLLFDNSIPILFSKNMSSTRKEFLDELDKKKQELEAKQKLRDMDIDRTGDSANEKKVNSDKAISLNDIEKLTKDGNYSELIRISRSINCSPPVIEKATASIKEAAFNAVNDLEIEGLSSKHFADDAVKKLIKIASDKQLVIVKDTTILKEAGRAAINIAQAYRDTTSNLIAIANNNALHHTVIVEAIVAFSEIVFADPEFFKDELEIAKRSISLRWLNIAYDVAHTEMSKEARDHFIKFQDFILRNR